MVVLLSWFGSTSSPTLNVSATGILCFNHNTTGNANFGSRPKRGTRATRFPTIQRSNRTRSKSSMNDS